MKKELLNKTIVVYTIICIAYQALIILLPVKEFFAKDGWSLLSKGLAVCGIILVALDLFDERSILKGMHSKWLCLLICAMLLASLVRFSYGFSDNIKSIIWNIVQMLLIYTVPMRVSSGEYKRIFVRLHAFASVIFVPALVYMFYQFLMQQHYVAVDGTHQGWHEGRLFGIMSTLYYGTIYVAIMAFATIYLLRQSKHGMTKILYGVEFAVFVIYIALSDTRTIYVGCAVGIAVAFFALCRRRYVLNGKKNTFQYIFKGVVLYAVLLLMAGIMVRCIRISGLNLAYRIESRKTAMDTETAENVETAEKFYMENKRPKQSTLSSRRGYIWMSYYEILTDRPTNLILGFSPGGYEEYIRKNYPESYIVEAFKEFYPISYQKGEVYGTHNGYLQVLMTTGILGFLALAVYLIWCSVDSLRYAIQGMGGDFEILVMALVTMILSAVLFETDVFLRTTETSFVFWSLGGYLMNEIYRGRKE